MIGTGAVSTVCEEGLVGGTVSRVSPSMPGCRDHDPARIPRRFAGREAPTRRACIPRGGLRSARTIGRGSPNGEVTGCCTLTHPPDLGDATLGSLAGPRDLVARRRAAPRCCGRERRWVWMACASSWSPSIAADSGWVAMSPLRRYISQLVAVPCRRNVRARHPATGSARALRTLAHHDSVVVSRGERRCT